MTSSEYVAAQAQLEVPSAPKMGGPAGVTKVWEQVIHAIRVGEPEDADGRTKSVCDRAVFRANPSEWPPTSRGTEICFECDQKAD
jgi:hypothetical protein